MSITTPDGGAINYSYDALGNLSTVTYPDRASKTYLYEDNSHPSALTGVMDENRQRYATWKYDTQGRGAISYQGDGRNQVTVSFDTDGQSVTTDSLGAVRTRVLQVAAGVPKVNVYRESYGIGNVRSQSFTYDVNSNVASHTDFNGVTTTYIYDLTRNLETSRTEAKGSPRERTITTIWNSTWALPDTVTEPNRKTKYDYDTSGNLLTKTVTASNGAKRVWSWTYGSYGLVLTATNPDSKTTTYTYDTSRNVATITNPAGQITQFTKYDDNGNLLSMIDINQQTTTFGYDPRGRLKTRKTGSEQTTFDYDLAGQLKVVHFPDGSTLSYDYDAAHRLTDIRDNRNGRIHYDLFDDGNIKREDRYDPDGTLANALQQAKAQRTPPAQQAKAQ
ncbi:YD repeat-containing protein [Andreprevotia lacus DSM 23236]|uniref:YD repeat-containing protein n=2 Tax=Andreprevotia TaxID=397275 RepID=A0A1W1XVT7_9NEIS|nr:YD repeat-containing protein [Andreprevotia lacus DSM 23236]